MVELIFSSAPLSLINTRISRKTYQYRAAERGDPEGLRGSYLCRLKA